MPTTWTTTRLLGWTAEAFAKAGLDQPRLSAEMLMAHVLGVKRLSLYMDPDRPATDLERAAFRSLVERALRHEPVEYLTGVCPFFSMVVKVSPAVLIPRPSTEAVLEHVLQHARRTPGFAEPSAVDVGTGSGVIALALAQQWKRAGLDYRVTATDLSPEALAIAKENAQTLGLAEEITFRSGDLLEPVRADRFQYVISNPPYIPDDEWDEVPENVKGYEPELALRGGVDGLDAVRRLIEDAPSVLAQPGQLVIELASQTAESAAALAEARGFQHVAVLPDHEKKPRVLVADWA